MRIIRVLLSARSFTSARALAWLNIGAVGLALSAFTSAALGGLMPHVSALATGLPTLVFGLLWAWLLRSPRTVSGTKLRVGWVASLPLAVLNAGVACAAMFVSDAGANDLPSRLLGGFVLGAIVGSTVWVPALVVALVLFGGPVAWAHRLAQQGLAGAERGEAVVGLACAGLSALAALVSSAPGSFMPRREAPFTILTAMLAFTLGAFACALSWRRERARARFVASVERGDVAGYRVDSTAQGKALVRVAEQGSMAYRVSDFREEVCLLDAEGRATELRRAR